MSICKLICGINGAAVIVICTNSIIFFIQIDFVKIDLNKIIAKYENISAVKFFFDESDIKRFEIIEKKYKENIKEIFIKNNFGKVTDSSNRNGYCILEFNKNFDRNKLEEVLK